VPKIDTSAWDAVNNYKVGGELGFGFTPSNRQVNITNNITIPLSMTNTIKDEGRPLDEIAEEVATRLMYRLKTMG
jgi:hypothetical protein